MLNFMNPILWIFTGYFSNFWKVKNNDLCLFSNFGILIKTSKTFYTFFINFLFLKTNERKLKYSQKLIKSCKRDIGNWIKVPKNSKKVPRKK